MSLEFKTFGRTSRGVYFPAAAIYKSGYIYLNAFCGREYHLKDKKYALLGYDSDKKIVAIRWFNKWQMGVRKISMNKNANSPHGLISARGFIEHYQIPTGKTFYRITELNDMLIFSLDEATEQG